MATLPRLLCYGHDELLLFTRKCVLEQEYAVETCRALTALPSILAAGPVDVVVLCHSVPDAECHEVMAFVRQRSPGVKMLTLTESAMTDCAEQSDEAVEGLAGPTALLRQVRALVEEQG